MPHTTTQPTTYEREMRFRALLLERMAAEYDGEAMEAQWRRTAPERE